MAKSAANRNRVKLQESSVKFEALFGRIFRSQSLDFYKLLFTTLFLVAFGVVMVLSASSIDALKADNNSFAIFLKQALYAVVGLVVMSIASIVPTIFWFGKAKFLYLVTMAAQFLVLFIGKDINGNRNWLAIGPIAVQPSEFLKVTVVIHVAAFLAPRRHMFEDRRFWTQAGVMMGAAMALVIFGKDLGTTIVMFIMFLTLLALAGLPMKLMRLVLIGAAALTPILVNWGSTSRAGRIMAWINPSAPDPNGYNWQPEHGMWAIAAGRIFGSGLGESKMKWSWIPEVENDFIFAVIAEEFGLIGALVVVALFVYLAMTFINIWKRTADDFNRYVVSGIMIWIVAQALVNMAVVLRLLPVLGVPLPLISAGGSSLIATLGAIGIVLAVERDNHANPLGRQGRMPQARQLRRVR